MIIAHHLIWTVYGWWLPNDPRGSSSQEIRVEPIAELGELHHGRKTHQPLPRESRAFYDRARDTLRHPLLTFDADDIQVVANGIRQTIAEQGYTCFACAVLPDHVHLLVRRHRDRAELMLEHFQRTTRAGLIAAERRLPHHPVWGGPGWKVFLDTPEAVERVLRYIHDNPLKARLPEQSWDFVVPYAGWVPRSWQRPSERET